MSLVFQALFLSLLGSNFFTYPLIPSVAQHFAHTPWAISSILKWLQLPSAGSHFLMVIVDLAPELQTHAAPVFWSYIPIRLKAISKSKMKNQIHHYSMLLGPLPNNNKIKLGQPSLFYLFMVSLAIYIPKLDIWWLYSSSYIQAIIKTRQF